MTDFVFDKSSSIHYPPIISVIGLVFAIFGGKIVTEQNYSQQTVEQSLY